MGTLFLVCAVIGGTFVVLQFGLSLLGVGGDLGGDLPDVDLPDGAVGHDAGGFSDLAKKLTFQSIVAFVTFFGIAGLAAQGAGWSGGLSLTTAIVTGLAAMAVLGYAFGLLRKLQGSGSITLENAVGEVGRIYVRVPGGNGGVGKIIVPVQGRSEEVRAVTSGPELRSGEPVVVVHAIDNRTLEVVSQGAYVEKAASLAD